jgi:hypothetical protein
MLANFKRTIQVSVLLSALAASAVGAVGVAGIAYAAPNFERVFESPYSQLLLAHKSATPASGNYDNAVQPVKISMQNEGALTNVIAPSFPNSTGNVLYTAQTGTINGAPRPVLHVIAVNADYNTLGKLFPTPAMAVGNGNHAKIKSAAVCRALDARLDKRHLPILRERAILAHHGCGIRSTGSIES